jgi:uridine kinase
MVKKKTEEKKKGRRIGIVGGTARGKGTRYSCLYSTVRRNAGTTYSPKY